MNQESIGTFNTQSILETLTQTLLYEGYALFPYHRSALKNQKPMLFGIVFPEDFNAHNPNAHSLMQTESIMNGDENLSIDINVRFLHLKKIEVYKSSKEHEIDKEDFVSVHSIIGEGISCESGWQAVERIITVGKLEISELLKNRNEFLIKFSEVNDIKYINPDFSLGISYE